MLQLSLRESHPALIEHHPMQLLSPARIAESNDGFMNDCRRLLRGDENALRNFTMRANRNQKGCAVINYVTNHDGFTLADLVS